MVPLGSAPGAGGAVASLRGLLDPEKLRRLALPLLAAASVFVVVVAPVASLDPAAFYADIVKYNVGLPGDNYPLGGTPGFGFANFLIGYGGVTSLSEYFPFGRFYLLFVPLGLALLARQLRAGRVEAALVTGSAALVASLYFSRVVHPNYLIPAAILLPVGVLALRWPADLALTPLALGALAVTFSEQEVFRAVWDQAVAARVPDVLPAFVRALLPASRGGADHRPDRPRRERCVRRPRPRLPRGGCAWLDPPPSRAPSGPGSGHRGGALPPWLLIRDRHPHRHAAGPRRVDRTAALPTPRGLRHAEPLHSSRAGRAHRAGGLVVELPPRSAGRVPPDRPLVPPGGPVVAALAGVRDPRSLLILSLGVTGLGIGLIVARVSPTASLTAAGCTLLAPMALGTVFGARSLAMAGGLVLTAWLASSGRSTLAPLVLGATAAVDTLALAAAPLLSLDSPAAESSRPSPGRSLALLALGFGTLVVPVFLLDATAASTAFLPRVAAGPGIGLLNLLAYWGPEPAIVPAVCTFLVGALLLTGLWLAPYCRPDQAPALAALLGLTALWLHPAPPAGSLVLPLVLLTLAAPALAVSGEGDG